MKDRKLWGRDGVIVGSEDMHEVYSESLRLRFTENMIGAISVSGTRGRGSEAQR